MADQTLRKSDQTLWTDEGRISGDIKRKYKFAQNNYEMISQAVNRMWILSAPFRAFAYTGLFPESEKLLKTGCHEPVDLNDPLF